LPHNNRPFARPFVVVVVVVLPYLSL